MRYRDRLIHYITLILHICGFNPLKNDIFSSLRAMWTSLSYMVVMISMLLELFSNFQGYATIIRVSLLPILLTVPLKAYLITVLRKNIRKMILKTQQTLAELCPDLERDNGEANSNLVYKFFKVYCLGILLTVLQMMVQALLTRTPVVLTYKESELTDIYWSLVFILDFNFFVFIPLFIIGYNWLFLFFSTCVVSEMKTLNAAFGDTRFAGHSEYLKILVDHHNHVLSIVNDMNLNYSPTLLIDYTLNCLSFCFSLYCMMMDGFPPDSEHIMRYGLVAWNCVMIVALSCYAGDAIKEQCGKLAVNFFYEALKKPLNKNTKFECFMIIGRSQKKTCISIGGFLDLSMESFYLTLGKCLSLITFIQTLKEMGSYPTD